MKKRRICLCLALILAFSLMTGTVGFAAGETWTVTCPWAPYGVASLVSQKVAALSAEYSDDITLVAFAQKGDAATVNTWVLDNEAGDTGLVFVGEGLLSITSMTTSSSWRTCIPPCSFCPPTPSWTLRT